jgi:hypothetical protein
LDYDYLVDTDITDCYGSIYTHSVPWSIHGKKEAKNNKFNNDYVGNVIDDLLQNMSYGQTNGIPQGSALMDFVAEIVLYYIDKLLDCKLADQDDLSQDKYKIIRYRDDYRIFVNNPCLGKRIVKNLTNVLSSLGMKLNDSKTKISDDIVKSSVKSDKFYWVSHGKYHKSFSKQLFAIKDLAAKHPNSGTLNKQLQKFYERLENLECWSSNVSINVMISIIVNIAFHNPRTYPISAAIISKFLGFFDTISKQKEIIEKIKNKFEQLPNTGHLLLWLQRITIKLNQDISYKEALCKKVNEEEVEIWNSSWLKSGNLKEIIEQTKIVDQDEIEDLDTVISEEEVSLFKTRYNR